MKTLLLLRHAKSSWADASLDDHRRPLNGRGRRAASAMGDYVSRHGLLPDLVLCSSALRTRETWERLSAAWPAGVECVVEDRLYLASRAQLLAVVRELDAERDRVMLIGHNPGTAELATVLAGAGADSALTRLHAKYPTAALTEISFQVASWGGVAAGGGRLERFVKPRDLE